MSFAFLRSAFWTLYFVVFVFFIANTLSKPPPIFDEFCAEPIPGKLTGDLFYFWDADHPEPSGRRFAAQPKCDSGYAWRRE